MSGEAVRGSLEDDRRKPIRLGRPVCDDGRLMTEQEAIETLGLLDRANPRGALRWLMRTQRLAYVRLARGMYAFRPADLAAFIGASRVPASGETKENRYST